MSRIPHSASAETFDARWVASLCTPASASWESWCSKSSMSLPMISEPASRRCAAKAMTSWSGETSRPLRMTFAKNSGVVHLVLSDALEQLFEHWLLFGGLGHRTGQVQGGPLMQRGERQRLQRGAAWVIHALPDMGQAALLQEDRVRRAGHHEVIAQGDGVRALFRSPLADPLLPALAQMHVAGEDAVVGRQVVLVQEQQVQTGDNRFGELDPGRVPVLPAEEGESLALLPRDVVVEEPFLCGLEVLAVSIGKNVPKLPQQFALKQVGRRECTQCCALRRAIVIWSPAACAASGFSLLPLREPSIALRPQREGRSARHGESTSLAQSLNFQRSRSG